MTEVEKLRALLAETRKWLKTYRDPNDGFPLYAATPLMERIDAALAESPSGDMRPDVVEQRQARDK